MCSSADAQRKGPLAGIVYDAGTGLPLPGVDVKAQYKTIRTDTKGFFEIDISRSASIEVNHIHYHSRQFDYTALRGIDTLTVYLTPNTSTFKNIIVSDGAETIYQPDFENVLDFAFIHDTLAVLSYMKSKPSVEHRQTVYLQNTLTLLRYGKRVQRLTLPDYVEGIHVDPFGRVFVTGAGFVMELKSGRDGAYLVDLEEDYFATQIKPLTAHYRSNIFFKVDPDIVPEVVHYVLLTEIDSVKPVRMIRNKKYFEGQKASYKSLSPYLKEKADKLAQEYNRPGEDFAPAIQAQMVGRFFYRPDNQAFAEGDNIIIYDHTNSWIFKHDIYGNPVDSVWMYYHVFSDERYKGTIQDAGSGQCFAMHEKGGVFYLRFINHNTGGAGKPFKLKYPYVRSVRIYDGWVYYVYRDLSGNEPYKLVREKIPREAVRKT
jgi:hypothetical protein